MDCTINVMMFGGRRCGKTSVIAAMKKCFENIYGADEITISLPEQDKSAVISDKYTEIEGYFNKQTQGIVFDSATASTVELSEYKLRVSLKSKSTGSIILSLCDYPGEWLDSGHADKQQLLSKRMKSCRIILIAVDTVFLMEKTSSSKSDAIGIYNENRNYSRKVADMVKESFKVNDGEEPKMVMIVPLKCEKYYNHGQMQLVNEKIHAAYKPLFDFLDGSNKTKYEVVIAPILTLGANTAEFARFERNENAEIELDPDLKIPAKTKYNFVNVNCEYSPQYCEQPLLYSLSYLIDQIEKLKRAEKKNAPWYKKLYLAAKEYFGDLASAEDFLRVKGEITGKLKKKGDGYEIVSDPLGLRS